MLLAASEGRHWRYEVCEHSDGYLVQMRDLETAEIALEAGADDYKQSEDIWEITCEPSAFEPLRSALAARNIEPQSAELVMIPASTVTVDAESARKVLNLMEAFEEHDDVQNVYSNFDIPSDVMAGMG